MGLPKIILVCLLTLKLGYPSQSEETALNFMVVGDWGGLPIFPYRTFVERAVAQSLESIAAKYNTSFQLALGDNFYFEGVKDVHDKRFQETFETVFTGPYLQNDWYLVAGNHDWNGNVSAQIAYSNISKRWNFPSYYYSLNFKSPGGATVQIIMIDTILLCGELVSDFVDSPPRAPHDLRASEKQIAWIEDMLKKSRSDYLIVAGHFPVYSIAEHGPTDCLIKQLRPLLYKYDVTAYMSGHDHNLQHLLETTKEFTPNTRMDYFVVGSANFVESSTAHKNSVPTNSSKFFYADYGGFALVNVTSQQLTMTFISQEQKELYQVVKKPRKL